LSRRKTQLAAWDSSHSDSYLAGKKGFLPELQARPLWNALMLRYATLKDLELLRLRNGSRMS